MISIILNTHNHINTTSKYLPGILDCGVEKQVLINENASTDGCAEYVDSLNPDIVLHQKENIGVPRGYNELLPYVAYDYIAKVDPDFILPKEWAKIAIDICKDKSIGLVGFFWSRNLTHPDLQKGVIGKLNNNIIFEPTKVFGCWVFRTDILNEVGMFYDQVLYGNWDSEFNERLKKHGYRNVYCQFDSIHMGEDTLNERNEKNAHRVNDIPDLKTYKLDEFREYRNRVNQQEVF